MAPPSDEERLPELRRVWVRPEPDYVLGDDDSALPIDDPHFHRYCDVFPCRTHDDRGPTRDGDGRDDTDATDEDGRDDTDATDEGERGSTDPTHGEERHDTDLDAIDSTEDEGNSDERSDDDRNGVTSPDDEREREKSEIRFVGGLVRTGLRHTPLVVLGATVAFFGAAEFLPEVEGLSTLLPTLSSLEWLGIGAGLLLYICLLGLIWRIGLISLRECYKCVFVYGLFAALATGTAYSTFLVYVHASLASPPPNNVVFTSGYLLLLLVGGLLVYDGVIRTEHMINHLEETKIVENDGGYDDWRESLGKKLSHSIIDGQSEPLPGWVRVPTAYVVSVLFVAQFALVWWIGQGPQNLNDPVTLTGNVLLNVFIAVVAFQFLVLIREFYVLITDDVRAVSTGQAPILGYVPYHWDGHGGYRDLGKFATRVNLLLIVAGFYLVYRAYVQGSRVTPAEMAPGFDPVVGSAIWLASFVVPIAIYGLVSLAWLYYSFWQIHLRMRRGRERLYANRTDDTLTSNDWRLLWNAPVWPIDNGQLYSLVGATYFPLVIWLLDQFLF